MTDLEPFSPEEGVTRFLRHREPSVRDSTLQNSRTRLNHFLDWYEEVGIENLNDLSGHDPADFVARRRGDIAPITLQKQLSTMRAALGLWADIEGVEDGLRERVRTSELPDGVEAHDVHLSADRTEPILDYLDHYQHTNRGHVITALLWRTGMCRGVLRALDAGDLHADNHAAELIHRPETDTALKNDTRGERWVYLGPEWFEVIDEYVATNRYDAVDDHGHRPLITSKYGRPTGDTIYKWIGKLTRPCEYDDCPHGRERAICDAAGSDGHPSRYPSSRSPHVVRRGHITAYLSREVSPEMISGRSDMSFDILYRHYDARTPREKMNVRIQNLPRVTTLPVNRIAPYDSRPGPSPRVHYHPRDATQRVVTPRRVRRVPLAPRDVVPV